VRLSLTLIVRNKKGQISGGHNFTLIKSRVDNTVGVTPELPLT
jgi:hypothetical protein